MQQMCIVVADTPKENGSFSQLHLFIFLSVDLLFYVTFDACFQLSFIDVATMIFVLAVIEVHPLSAHVIIWVWIMKRW